MQLTKDNLSVYAARYYDNPFCLTEDEFKSDVFKASIIRKMLTAYSLNNTTNLKMLVNTVISFFNVFDHKAATEILKLKLDPSQYDKMNSILKFLSFSTIPEHQIDLAFLQEISEAYNDKA